MFHICIYSKSLTIYILTKTDLFCCEPIEHSIYSDPELNDPLYFNEDIHYTGCSQKKDLLLWRAIEPLRIEVGIKVRGVSESAGADLFGKYHNFLVAHLGPEIFEFKVGPVPEIIFLM